MWSITAWLVAAASGAAMLPLKTWTADLNPVGGHRVSGTATVNTDTKDATKVSITLDNATPNAMLAWHLYRGACSTASAAVVQSENLYQPVQADANGHASASVTLPVNLESGTYSVRVKEPAAMRTDTTKMDHPMKDGDLAACGDLRASGDKASN